MGGGGGGLEAKLLLLARFMGGGNPLEVDDLNCPFKGTEEGGGGRGGGGGGRNPFAGGGGGGLNPCGCCVGTPNGAGLFLKVGFPGGPILLLVLPLPFPFDTGYPIGRRSFRGGGGGGGGCQDMALNSAVRNWN
jgi:hypothetical protein